VKGLFCCICAMLRTFGPPLVVLSQPCKRGECRHVISKHHDQVSRGIVAVAHSTAPPFWTADTHCTEENLLFDEQYVADASARLLLCSEQCSITGRGAFYFLHVSKAKRSLALATSWVLKLFHSAHGHHTLTCRHSQQSVSGHPSTPHPFPLSAHCVELDIFLLKGFD
jgi:hypothetical protein